MLKVRLPERATRLIQMVHLSHTKRASEVAEAAVASVETRAATTTESTTPMRKASLSSRMKRITTTTILQEDTKTPLEETSVEAEVASKRMEKDNAVDAEVAVADPGLLKNIKM